MAQKGDWSKKAAGQKVNWLIRRLFDEAAGRQGDFPLRQLGENTSG